ncbi:E3 ubiquitin-protein ligase CHFR [Egretta garzetta]|uniref:E3 ubiquitin-protein ligase CHFR n=1 Tax=Egretta garzetta TaxID=188379 RepID=UPI00051EF7F9|nr:E3 ubiquitin-protein ligase CHFR [Egretta garzetta]
MEHSEGGEQSQQQQPWGKLIRLGADEAEPHVLLLKREWTIGRKKGCDLSFPGNKLVSGDHCKIVVDEESGQVSLEDTSTNGTVINKLKVVKKQTYPLQTGDVIYVVYRKNEPENSKGGGGESPRGNGQLDMNTETSAITSEITDKEKAESDSQRTGEEESLEPAKKKLKGDEDACPNLSPAAPSECIIKIGSEDAKTSNVKPDKMEETLTCIICQELLHDCVSLQPCMHTFCAACYSGWMERSSLCPTCRCPVERICKNHILNNLVEAYLIQHPDKCRNEDDVRSMDARNKITQDMLQPKVRRSFSDEEGSSEDLLELSDVDSESSDISQPYIVCRQCPGYRRHSVPTLPGTGQETEAGGMQALGDAPSTSANFPAAVQEYVCPAQGSHVICTCCFQPMPDRRAEREQNPHVAPQQCTVCLQPFCHLYWGCARMACFGCLAPFCEINLGDKCLDGVLNNNHYESDILKDYLASRGLTWKNMLNESLLALQRGVFMLSDYRITGNTVLCYCCGLRSFRELAYQYRQNIPVAELPVTVTSRPDCYWGRNCRTQVKAHHAMKFNHICEQTRFKN